MTAITGGSPWIINVLKAICLHAFTNTGAFSSHRSQLHFSAHFNLKPDNDTSERLQYLWGDDPVVGEALRYVVAMLGETVGDVHRPGLTLMWGVEALREVWKRKREGIKVGQIQTQLSLAL